MDDLMDEDDDLLNALRQMEGVNEFELPEERLDEEGSLILKELNQIVRPASMLHMKAPKPKETWRHIQSRQVHTIVKVTKTEVSLFDGKEPLKLPLQLFQETYEKVSEVAAGDAPPQDGEVWQNIHTGYKATINGIKDARMGKEVHWTRDGKQSHTDLKSFVANWRRIKTSSKWFVGAMKLLD